MRTRCRFQVEKVARYASYEIVTFNATWDAADEHQSYSEHSPLGRLEITVTDHRVMGTFHPNGIYFLDLTPVG